MTSTPVANLSAPDSPKEGSILVGVFNVQTNGYFPSAPIIVIGDKLSFRVFDYKEEETVGVYVPEKAPYYRVGYIEQLNVKEFLELIESEACLSFVGRVTGVFPERFQGPIDILVRSFVAGTRFEVIVVALEGK
jgi:hypothetical protein